MREFARRSGRNRLGGGVTVGAMVIRGLVLSPGRKIKVSAYEEEYKRESGCLLNVVTLQLLAAVALSRR